jgi:steroid delta-isomerase-like uncharacterized protein
MMGTTDNKEVSTRFIEEVFNKGNYDLIDDLLAENFVAHFGGGEQGRDAFQQTVRAYRNGFPDYHCTIDDQIAENDQVVTRWTFHGTQSGQLMGIPPTGKRVTVTGIAIDRMADGKLVESWLEMDAQRMLQDLGVAPPS